MDNNFIKKGLVLVIIVLFVGTNYIPSICGDEQNQFLAEFYQDSYKSLYYDYPPIEEWNKSIYGGHGNKIIETSDNRYVCVGSTLYWASQATDVWLAKIDNNGNELWNKSYDKYYYDAGYSVVQTPDNGFLIVGYGKLTGPYYNAKPWVIKTNDKGEMEWDKIYDKALIGGSYVNINGEFMSICKSNDGNYVIAGFAKHNYLWLLKIDINGNRIWEHVYQGGYLIDYGFLCKALNEGYLITCQRFSGSSFANIWLIRTDLSGNIIWNKNYDVVSDDGDERPISIQQLINGDVIITATYNSHAGARHYFMRTDKYGQLLEFEIMDDTTWIYDSQPTVDKGFFVFGMEEDEIYHGHYHIMIWKMNEAGTMTWKYLWEGFSVGPVYDGIKTIDGIIVCLSSSSNWLYTLFVKFSYDNQVPEKPLISGPTNGNVGDTYDYYFSSVDPDGHDLYYFVDWGDGSCTNWFGPFNSGEQVKMNHSWGSEGTFIIRVKSQDILGGESDWGELEVTMPRNRVFNINSLFLRFLENHPNLFPILRQLLRL